MKQIEDLSEVVKKEREIGGNITDKQNAHDLHRRVNSVEVVNLIN